MILRRVCPWLGAAVALCACSRHSDTTEAPLLADAVLADARPTDAAVRPDAGLLAGDAVAPVPPTRLDATSDALADALADATPDTLADATPDAIADATPDALPADGFTAGDRAVLLAMRRPAGPPPDPTNRFADDPAAARLGQRLFYARDLSSNGLPSCSGCHSPAHGFSSQLSYDAHGGLDFRSVPTLLDASHRAWFFWDGAADTQWAQARTPLESRHELDHDRVRVLRYIHERPVVRRDFEAAFGPLPAEAFWARLPLRAKPSDDPGDAALDTAWRAMSEADRETLDALFAQVLKALAAFQRRLSPGPSPFDAFLDALAAGAPDAADRLDPAALRGLRLFIGPAACVACHEGPMLADDDFHNVGLARLVGAPLDTGRSAALAEVLADRFNAAGRHSDDPDGPQAARLAGLVAGPETLGAFRTPTLRNVALTGPYLHDGRFETLVEIVRYKTTLPDLPAIGALDPALVPYPATDAEIDDLVAFLNTLTSPPLDASLTGPPP